jgi:hypothetical protein
MRYSLFSGGGGSYRATKLDKKAYPDAPRRLVFTDTLYEDADLYRFLIEAAADVLGRKLSWSISADDFPDYRVIEDVPIEEYRGNPEWRDFLADLRERTASDLPELIWLVEGRDPWEVYRDERMVGNSLKDPCSKFIKRNRLDAWRKAACIGARDTFIVGIGEHEKHRFDDGQGGALGPRMKAAGWHYEAPLIGQPELNPGLWMASARIAPPRLYALGYQHNNCGGMCCKAGHAHWQNRARVHPERFAYDAMMERKVRNYLGKPAATMLNDRRGDKQKKPLSLDAFADRLAAQPEVNYDYEPGSSGCGCMVEAA